MTKCLIDTDILSEYFKGYDAVVRKHAARYADDHGVFTFTSVTVHEIIYGLEVKGAYSQRGRALAWFSQNVEITPTDADYLSAATIRAGARRRGSVLELADCLIASVAIRLDAPLVTGNTADFEAMRRTGVKLQLENWRLV